jgi:hypothetical protein
MYLFHSLPLAISHSQFLSSSLAALLKPFDPDFSQSGVLHSHSLSIATFRFGKFHFGGKMERDCSPKFARFQPPIDHSVPRFLFLDCHQF